MEKFEEITKNPRYLFRLSREQVDALFSNRISEMLPVIADMEKHWNYIKEVNKIKD
jgi:hypothetical protein